MSIEKPYNVEIVMNGYQFAKVGFDTVAEARSVARGLLGEITYRMDALAKKAAPAEPQEQREPYAWTWRDYEDTPAIFTEAREVAEAAAIEGYKVTPLYR